MEASRDAADDDRLGGIDPKTFAALGGCCCKYACGSVDGDVVSCAVEAIGSPPSDVIALLVCGWFIVAIGCVTIRTFLAFV